MSQELIPRIGAVPIPYAAPLDCRLASLLDNMALGNKNSK